MIQRYDPACKERYSLGVWDAYMEPNRLGDFVTYDDHHAAVGELVEALRKAVLALAHAEEQSPGLYAEAYEAVSDAIAKHGGTE